MTDDTRTDYRAGAIRWFDTIDNDHVVVEPGHTMYSTGLMVATEYWSCDRKAWVEISPEKKDA